MTPLVTVTPRLEQEVRYDQYWQNLGNGGVLDTYGSGKGLELIPTTTNEVLINPPAYQERYNKKPASGWADDQFLIIKQRLLSANEQNGNYIVTAFLGFTAPTGTPAFTNRSWIITPTLAGGKGWGDFNIQATVGIPVPLAHHDIIGTSIATNVALQYHVLQYFWPEFEMNYTYWANGLRGGKNQIFLTPGLILGRFEIHDRVRFIIGAGYQFAVSPALTKEPVLTPTVRPCLDPHCAPHLLTLCFGARCAQRCPCISMPASSRCPGSWRLTCFASMSSLNPWLHYIFAGGGAPAISRTEGALENLGEWTLEMRRLVGRHHHRQAILQADPLI